MQQIRLNKNSANVKKSFWRKQFEAEPTKGQKQFDWFFGVIMPPICFLFDPIVFKTAFGNGQPLYGKYKPFAYVLSYFSILALIAFLIWGKKSERFNAFFGGLFLIGGIISLIVGVILFPFSFVGLIIVIGALGFTPLFTAFVYLRNAFRAFQTAKPFFNNAKLWKVYILTATFSLIFPALLNIQIERIFSAVEYGDAETVRANARTIRIFAPIINPNRLLENYIYSSWENPDEKQQAIGKIYKEITGKDAQNINIVED